MPVFNLKTLPVYPYDERVKNVFYAAPEFKARMIELPPGGEMPPCEMASYVFFYKGTRKHENACIAGILILGHRSSKNHNLSERPCCRKRHESQIRLKFIRNMERFPKEFFENPLIAENRVSNWIET